MSSRRRKSDIEAGSLLLTRHAGQSFWIGDNVRIRVISLSHKVVRVCITAPRELRVLREELKAKPPRQPAPESETPAEESS